MRGPKKNEKLEITIKQTKTGTQLNKRTDINRPTLVKANNYIKMNQ